MFIKFHIVIRVERRDLSALVARKDPVSSRIAWVRESGCGIWERETGPLS